MSWFDHSIGRRILRPASFLLALMLVSCGFQPMHATSDNAAVTPRGQLAEIFVEQIRDREGQILRNLLIDRFSAPGFSGGQPYRLASEISTSKQNLGTQLDASTTRARLTVTVRFRLAGANTQRKFTSRIVASYSTSESDYATLVAERDATERALREIADDVTRQILLHFEQNG